MIGETLKKLRKQRGLSQKALADKSGINQGFISEIENGKKSPGIDTLKSLSQTLEVPIGALAGDPAYPHGIEKFQQFAQDRAANDTTPAGQSIQVNLLPDELELISLYRQADKDRQRHLIDCARMIVDATVARAESLGKGRGECDLKGKKSA